MTQRESNLKVGWLRRCAIRHPCHPAAWRDEALVTRRRRRPPPLHPRVQWGAGRSTPIHTGLLAEESCSNTHLRVVGGGKLPSELAGLMGRDWRNAFCVGGGVAACLRLLADLRCRCGTGEGVRAGEEAAACCLFGEGVLRALADCCVGGGLDQGVGLYSAIDLGVEEEKGGDRACVCGFGFAGSSGCGFTTSSEDEH